MTTLALIVAPKWRTVLTRVRQESAREGRGKALVLGSVGLVFWTFAFGVSYRILRYFQGTEEIGTLLAGKMLGIILLSFASILLLSNVITALSSFFLAKDLDLLVSAPVDWLDLYLAKLGETLLHSSWMVALMAVPIFAAYGIVYHGGWLFPLVAVGTLLPLLILPAVIGTAVTLILVNVFPARRTRDLLSIVTIAAAGILILMFRMIRPEQLARPEGFRNLLDFITVLRTPASPLLPSEWAADTVIGWLVGPFDPFPLFLLWSTAAAAVVIGALVHARLYPLGFSKAQEGAKALAELPGIGEHLAFTIANLKVRVARLWGYL